MSKVEIIIGLDLGTTHCKAVAYSTDGILVSQVNNNLKTYNPHHGYYEQDPIEWIEAICLSLKQLSDKLGQSSSLVRAIGISSHGPSLVLANEELIPLNRSIIWQDRRGAGYVKRLISEFGISWIGKGQPAGSFLAKLYWAVENDREKIFEAKYILGTKGYIIGKLTGNLLDEPSSCCTPDGIWPEDIIKFLGLSPSSFPEIVPSETCVGVLLPNIASITGLPYDTKVIIGLTDGASACLGAGLRSVGQGIISIGTNGVVRCVVPERVSGDILLKHNMFCYPYIESRYITGGYTQCGGESINWFLDVFHKSFNGERIYDNFYIGASNSPVGSNGVIFLPYLFGISPEYEDKTLEGAFLGLSRNHDLSDMARSVLEGVAFSLHEIGDVIKDQDWPLNDIRLTGGGARNLLLQQIISDVFNDEVKWMPIDSPLGAAIVAGFSCGYFKNYYEAINTMTNEDQKLIIPNKKSHEELMKNYLEFKLYKSKLLR